MTIPSIPSSPFANGLNSATTTVVVNIATAPTSGQVLTATSGAAANWQTPGGGSSILQQVTVAVTSAQIKAMKTTPVSILPAPGAGLRYVVVSAVGEMIYGTSTYVGGTLTNLYFNNSSGGSPTGTGWQTLITVTASTEQTLPVATTLTANTLTNNAPIVLTCTAADPTLGDGTMNITVTYYTVAVH